MNTQLYEEAMMELQRLHRHLRNTNGPEAWTARLLRLFAAAAETPERDDEETMSAQHLQTEETH